MPTQQVVYTDIPRPPVELTAAFTRTSVASVHESMARTGLLDPGIGPLVPGLAAAGPAVTCVCHAGDNLTLHRAMAVCQPGDVLVITIDGHHRSAVWGGMVTISAEAIGLAGVIVDGAIRDSREIRERGFALWYRCIHAGGSVKRTLGAVNVPTVAGGVIVNPGDIVLADDDGVVIVPPVAAEGVLARAQARDAQERALEERLRNGERLYDILGLDAAVEAGGAIEIDGVYEAAVPALYGTPGQVD